MSHPLQLRGQRETWELQIKKVEMGVKENVIIKETKTGIYFAYYS